MTHNAITIAAMLGLTLAGTSLGGTILIDNDFNSQAPGTLLQAAGLGWVKVS